MSLLLIGVGGALGAIARYLVGGFVQTRAGGHFPWGTLVVNVTGCFALGALVGLAEARGAVSPEARAFLVVGVLGGFTTFSAFGSETVGLMLGRDPARALANVGASVVLGVAAVWIGRALAILASGGRG